MDKKIFSDSEVSKILKKAVEIQEKESGGYAAGVTLDELQRIASECGISNDALQAALVQPEEESKSSFLNLVEEHERVFEGELDFDNMDEVVEAVSQYAKVQAPMQFGRTMRTQVSSKNMIFGNLELSSRNGRTKLKFRQTPFIAYFVGLHLPLILSGVVGAATIGKGFLIPGLAALIGILGFGIFLFSYLAKVGKKKARELVDKISDQVSQLIARQNAGVRDNLAKPVAAASVEDTQQTKLHP